MLKFQDGAGNDIGINFRDYIPTAVPANANLDVHHRKVLAGTATPLPLPITPW